jgi:hypothetical protein
MKVGFVPCFGKNQRLPRESIGDILEFNPQTLFDHLSQLFHFRIFILYMPVDLKNKALLSHPVQLPEDLVECLCGGSVDIFQFDIHHRLFRRIPEVFPNPYIDGLEKDLGICEYGATCEVQNSK